MINMRLSINPNYEGKWEEVEIAVQEFKLFEAELLPIFTHTVCPFCYGTAIEELNRWK